MKPLVGVSVDFLEPLGVSFDDAFMFKLVREEHEFNGTDLVEEECMLQYIICIPQKILFPCLCFPYFRGFNTNENETCQVRDKYYPSINCDDLDLFINMNF